MSGGPGSISAGTIPSGPGSLEFGAVGYATPATVGYASPMGMQGGLPSHIVAGRGRPVSPERVFQDPRLQQARPVSPARVIPDQGARQNYEIMEVPRVIPQPRICEVTKEPEGIRQREVVRQDLRPRVVDVARTREGPQLIGSERFVPRVSLDIQENQVDVPVTLYREQIVEVAELRFDDVIVEEAAIQYEEVVKGIDVPSFVISEKLVDVPQVP